MLFDAFLYPENVGNTFPHQSYLLEIDECITEKLLSHLKRFILRNEVIITPTDEFTVWQAWGPLSHDLWQNYIPAHTAKTRPIGTIVSNSPFSSIGCIDPRQPQLGIRFLTKNNLLRNDFVIF